MFTKEENHFKLMFKLALIALLCQSSDISALRAPEYSTGKYTTTDVDTGTWSTTKTISNVSMDY